MQSQPSTARCRSNLVNDYLDACQEAGVIQWK